MKCYKITESQTFTYTGFVYENQYQEEIFL